MDASASVELCGLKKPEVVASEMAEWHCVPEEVFL
jgi:hypothetical protein